MLCSCILIGLLPYSILFLVAGVLLLDSGLQGVRGEPRPAQSPFAAFTKAASSCP